MSSTVGIIIYKVYNNLINRKCFDCLLTIYISLVSMLIIFNFVLIIVYKLNMFRIMEMNRRFK